MKISVEAIESLQSCSENLAVYLRSTASPNPQIIQAQINLLQERLDRALE